MSTYEKALEIATEIHKGQKRWDGKDYITHPIQVSNIVKEDKAKIVALLHDALEDHPEKVSLADLQREGFENDILVAINALTRREDEEYITYILRVSQNRLATVVKMADLYDNSSSLRQGSMKDKYLLATHLLEKIALQDQGYDPNLKLDKSKHVPSEKKTKKNVAD